MKESLIDKEVLCVYDIRAIQKFIFSNNNNIDILGAGEIIVDILREALEYAFLNCTHPLSKDEYCLRELERPDDIPYFYDENVKAQVVTIGGGNAFMLYRKGEIAQDINRAFAKYILENSYSLQIATASVEKSDNIANDINRLYVELDRIKNTQPFSHALGTLPIVKKEVSTGNPIAMKDPVNGEWISVETCFKRKKARSIKTMKDKIECIENLGGYNKFLAYIHIDGNSMGLTIGKIMNALYDYEEGVKARRYLNKNINEQYLATLNDTEEYLKNLVERHGLSKDDFFKHYQRIHVGGDDINIVCDIAWVFDFLEFFTKEIGKKYLWNDERIGKIKFSVCAGVGIVPGDTPYKEGVKIAEECCKEAKTEAKKPVNFINGEVGNWIDFQICDDKYFERVSSTRDDKYKIRTSGSTTDLCLRPYCLDKEKEDSLVSYDRFRELCQFIKEAFPDAIVRSKMMHAYSSGPTEVNELVNELIETLDKNEYEYFKRTKLPRLGKAYVTVEERQATVAHWYDALELLSITESNINDYDKFIR